jgi:hypothetical protein
LPQMPVARLLEVVGGIDQRVARDEPEPDRPALGPESENDTKVEVTASSDIDQKSKSAIQGCLRTGAVMTSLFPEGLHLTTEDDFALFRLMDRLVGSLTHFAESGMEHRTSLRDMATYTALLEGVLCAKDERAP